MKPQIDFLLQGGPAMAAILFLSVILYARCWKLLTMLRRSGRLARERRGELVRQPATVARLRDSLQESFRQQRLALGAMVAAAPLLGLLGTVGGMSKTFESLAQRSNGGGSMDALARGISEVLVATESGLAVAIPALLLVGIAQRQLQKQLQQLDRLEEEATS